MLLAKRDTILKRIYRAPIDLLEEWTTGMAHIVLVNSKFTGKSLSSYKFI
jgi:alpha-1,3/alpha-1,6-mannosyltransferase